jgi:hypothetical protein
MCGVSSHLSLIDSVLRPFCLSEPWMAPTLRAPSECHRLPRVSIFSTPTLYRAVRNDGNSAHSMISTNICLTHTTMILPPPAESNHELSINMHGAMDINPVANCQTPSSRFKSRSFSLLHLVVLLSFASSQNIIRSFVFATTSARPQHIEPLNPTHITNALPGSILSFHDIIMASAESQTFQQLIRSIKDAMDTTFEVSRMLAPCVRHQFNQYALSQAMCGQQSIFTKCYGVQERIRYLERALWIREHGAGAKRASINIVSNSGRAIGA